MIKKIEEIVHDNKTPGLNNPAFYVLTDNRLNIYLVLVFSDLNEAQIFKMQNRDNPHHEIEMKLSFHYLNVFKPNEHREDYQIRKPKNERFSFQFEDNEYVHKGDKLFSFQTTEKTMKYSSNLRFNEIKFPFAYGDENIYFTLHPKKLLFKNIKIQ